MAFFDRTGVLRVRWPIVPDTTNLGVILDSVGAVAADFERAAQQIEAGAADDGALDAGVGLARLGRVTDARAELARARAHGSAAVRQAAAVAEAVLDANAGNAARALPELEEIAARPQTPEIAADARAAIEAIHGTQQVAAAPIENAPIRVLPLARQVVSGRQPVRTHVAAAAVARVVFSLDGRDVARVERPPFSATVDFGAVPERRTIGVIAFDRRGRAIGRDERVVNEGGETFWLRLMSPREGSVSGSTQVTMSVRTPAARRVQRVVVSWNDARRAVLTAAPWECALEIPAGQLGVLRAVAELDDGRTSEDAVLLNAGGLVDQANVQLVELPLTMMSRNGVMPEVTPDRIVVREGTKLRRVEALATAAETPLTVGLLIDVSDSMQKTLPDVQEAAIRFLETVLGERDRAFLITFDTRARLLQPATSDVALLRRQIMSIRPNGLTALHDAMVLGLLQFEGIKGRRAVIVFSDGRDITSEYRATDVAALARRVNVPIHVVASVLDTPAALSGDAPAAAPSNVDEDLQRIAQSTGGTARALDNLAELPAVYARIEAALRAQVLAFIRTEPATKDNEWRSIRVEVEGKDVEVFAPAGYYAAW
jgi:VWFA-related protein